MLFSPVAVATVRSGSEALAVPPERDLAHARAAAVVVDLFGGGGGAGILDNNVGGGGGGSSLVPTGGGLTLATVSTPPTVLIASRLLPDTGTAGEAGRSVMRRQRTHLVHRRVREREGGSRSFRLTVPEAIQIIFNVCSNGSN